MFLWNVPKHRLLDIKYTKILKCYNIVFRCFTIFFYISLSRNFQCEIYSIGRQLYLYKRKNSLIHSHIDVKMCNKY
jgi:hypothetical protein